MEASAWGGFLEEELPRWWGAGAGERGCGLKKKVGRIGMDREGTACEKLVSMLK